jgi:hypothetical protein
VNVLNRLIDGRPFAKSFVEEMYDKLFNRYIDYFLKEGSRPFYHEEFKPSSLLLKRIEQWKDDYRDSSDEEKRRRIKSNLREIISQKPIKYKNIKEIMEEEMKKENYNLNALKVLIANCAYSNGSIDKIESKIDESMNTILKEVNDMLFDFYEHDYTLKLSSNFPTKKGSFDEKTSKDRVIFINTGERKFRDQAKELVSYTKDMEKRAALGRLNRYHYKSAEPFYWIFYDGFGLKQRESANNYEYRKIDNMAMAEFYDIVTLATAMKGWYAII